MKQDAEVFYEEIEISLVRGSKTRRGYLSVVKGDYVGLLESEQLYLNQKQEQEDLIKEHGLGPFKVERIARLNGVRLLFVKNEREEWLGLEWWRCHFYFIYEN